MKWKANAIGSNKNKPKRASEVIEYLHGRKCPLRNSPLILKEVELILVVISATSRGYKGASLAGSRVQQIFCGARGALCFLLSNVCNLKLVV